VTSNRFAFHLMRFIIQNAFNLVRLCQTKRFSQQDCINRDAFKLLRLYQPERLSFNMVVPTRTPYAFCTNLHAIPVRSDQSRQLDKPTEIRFLSRPVPLLAGNFHIHTEVQTVNTRARFPIKLPPPKYPTKRIFLSFFQLINLSEPRVGNSEVTNDPTGLTG